MLRVPLLDHAAGPARAPILVRDAEPLLLHIDWVTADPTRYSVWPRAARGPQVRKRQDLREHKGSNGVSETSSGRGGTLYRGEWWRHGPIPNQYPKWITRWSWQTFPASLSADHGRRLRSQRYSKYKRNVCIVDLGAEDASIWRTRSRINGLW